MNLEHDEENWSELTAFRKACLAGRYETMVGIAAKAHHWYPNENPADVPMERLAMTFQAQYYASTGDVPRLRDLIHREPWVVNEPWTAQGWLPITQGAATHGDPVVIDLLLEAGADVTMMVGDPGDRATIADMARSGGHESLARSLENLSSQRPS